MDVRDHNRQIWDSFSEQACPWTRPVSSAEIDQARRGDCRIFLTPSRPVPAEWLTPLAGRAVLCLASGGGQQGPILAAAGAITTVLDFSARQLERDRAVAERDGLDLRLLQGDMADLSAFDDESFDLVVLPVANVYIPDLAPLWREAARVLRPGGSLLAGFMNPDIYIFDQDAQAADQLTVRYQLPYSELTSVSPEERQRLIDEGDALQFSHTLEAQIAGQLAAGMHITGFYEDRRAGHPLAEFMPTHLATRAAKSGQ
ncbi:MAG TPA: class I SAM-dependent methyltransferase [Herpetosiphonaceae bacterium]|nr:class I SAM-dependent methyltransferase [Herpetosiphonaceae bacterium]